MRWSRKLSLVLTMSLFATLACGKSAAPAQKTYSLFWDAQKKEPPGGVTVKMTVPGNWEEKVDPTGSVDFKLPDVESTLPQLTLLAVPCSGDDDCLQKVIGRQFGAEDLAAAKREELGPGRVWISQDTPKSASNGRRVHARLFVLHPASKSVVMCFTMLLDAAGDKLPDIRKACESITL